MPGDHQTSSQTITTSYDSRTTICASPRFLHRDVETPTTVSPVISESRLYTKDLQSCPDATSPDLALQNVKPSKSLRQIDFTVDSQVYGSPSPREREDESSSQHEIVDDESQQSIPESIASDNTAYATSIPIGKTINLRRTVYGYPRSSNEFSSEYSAAVIELIELLEINLAKAEQTKSILRRQLQWNPWMCGRSPESATPALVLLCEKRHFADIAKVLTSRHVVEELNVVAPLCRQRKIKCTNDRVRFGLYFVAVDKPIDTFGAVFVQVGTLHTENVKQPDSKSLHGLKIYASESQSIATLTCLLQVGTQYYGLTTAHSFQADDMASNWSTINSRTESAADAQEHPDTSAAVVVTGVEEGFNELAGGELIVLQKPDMDPTIADLDWALVSLSEKSLYRLLLTEERSQQCSSISPSLPLEERSVLIYSSTTKPPVWGTLLRGKTYISLHAHTKRIEACSVQLSHDNELVKGDSGSIVVDAVTNIIYGYVVAVDAFAFVRVISLAAVVQQIKNKFNASQVIVADCKELIDVLPDVFQNWEQLSEISQQDREEDVVSDRRSNVADTASQHSLTAVPKANAKAPRGLFEAAKMLHTPQVQRASWPTAMDWEKIKPEFVRLYLFENRTLPDVIEHLYREYGFKASQRQYKSKIRAWALEKHLSKDKRDFIVAKAAERAKVNESTRFSVNGIEISKARLDIISKRSRGSTQADEHPLTPKNIIYFTPQPSLPLEHELEPILVENPSSDILAELKSFAEDQSEASEQNSSILDNSSGWMWFSSMKLHPDYEELEGAVGSTAGTVALDAEAESSKRRFEDDETEDSFPHKKAKHNSSTTESQT